MRSTLTVRTTNEIWAAAFAVLIIVYLCTFRLGGDKPLTDYLNFALALSSLILSLVGIVMTIFGSSELTKNFADLREAGHVTRRAADNISELTDKLADNFTTVLAEIGTTKQITIGMSDKLENYTAQKPVDSSSGVNSGLMDGFLSLTSNYGLCALYAAKLCEEKKKIISIKNISDRHEQYLLGFLVSCISARLFIGNINGIEQRFSVVSFPSVTIEALKTKLENIISRQKSDPKLKDQEIELEVMKRNIDRHFEETT